MKLTTKKSIQFFVYAVVLNGLIGGCSTLPDCEENWLVEFRATQDANRKWQLKDILQLISSESDLTMQERMKLEISLQQLDDWYPRLKKLLQSFYGDYGSLVFKVAPLPEGEGMYNADTGVITFSNITYITPERVLEELLHVVQHLVVYREKLKEDGNYMAKSKRNIEYEVLVFQDVMRYWKARRDADEGIGNGDVGLRGATEATNKEYCSWLFSLTMWNTREFALLEFNNRAENWPEYWMLLYNPDFQPLLLRNYIDFAL